MEFDSALAYLAEYGAMGLFAAWLAWNSLRQQRSEEQRVLQFQENIDRARMEYKEEVKEIRASSKMEIEMIRSRYDDVISGLNDDKTQVRQNIAATVHGLDRSIDGMRCSIEAAMVTIDSTHAMIKEMRDEQKIKDMAKRAMKES